MRRVFQLVIECKKLDDMNAIGPALGHHAAMALVNTGCKLVEVRTAGLLLWTPMPDNDE